MFDKHLTTPVTQKSVPSTGPQMPGSYEDRGILYMDEVFIPGKYPESESYKFKVPKEGRLVFDSETNIMYKCVKVDYEHNTLKPDFEVIFGKAGEEPDRDYDKDIFGINAGYQGEGIVAIDYSVRPNRATVDRQIVCPDAAYAILYKGSTLTEDNIISLAYQSTTSKKVPVMLAAINSLDNKTIMTTGTFTVSLGRDALPDGSKCTLLFFDNEGNLLSRPRILTAMHTAVLRDHLIDMRTIDSVNLIGPWFTNGAEPDAVYLPVNTIMRTLVFTAQVHYSNGEVENRIIDGQKIVLNGINNFLPTAPGAESALSLVYNLDPDERATQAQAGIDKKITKGYRVLTRTFEGAYTPKLYHVPVWKDGRFELRHFVMDLDRDFCIDVTDKTMMNDNSPAFRPNSYGVEQNLSFNLRLSDASPDFLPLIIRQDSMILLRKPANEPGSKWDVRYSFGKDAYRDPVFKSEHYDKGSRLTFSAGYKTQKEWLDNLYVRTEPAINITREKEPLVPTHFEIVDDKGLATLFSIDQWNTKQDFTRKFVTGDSVFIRWHRITEDGKDLFLSVGGASITV